MTILVLGANGFVGPHLLAGLSRRGVDAVGASRSGAGAFGVVLDRRDVAAVKALVRDRRIRVVVDLLAYTAAETGPLMGALEGEIERWVMASSCDVYRNYDGLHRRTEAPPTLTPMPETAALRERLFPYRGPEARPPGAADGWMDDYDKIPLEAALFSRLKAAGVVVRLPMIYGPADRQRRFRWIIGPMLDAKPSLTVDPAWSRWRTTYGYVADVGDALAAAALHPAAGGRVFNVGEEVPPAHRIWIDRFADQLQWRGGVVERPAEPQTPLAALDLTYPLVIDSAAIRTHCEWREPTPLDEALERTIADERDRS